MSTNYYVCCVCDEGFTEDPHTYHHEECPKRIDDPCQDTYECQNLPGCGEDCHPHHCPTCLGHEEGVVRPGERRERLRDEKGNVVREKSDNKKGTDHDPDTRTEAGPDPGPPPECPS